MYIPGADLDRVDRVQKSGQGLRNCIPSADDYYYFKVSTKYLIILFQAWKFFTFISRFLQLLSSQGFDWVAIGKSLMESV